METWAALIHRRKQRISLQKLCLDLSWGHYLKKNRGIAVDVFFSWKEREKNNLFDSSVLFGALRSFGRDQWPRSPVERRDAAHCTRKIFCLMRFVIRKHRKAWWMRQPASQSLHTQRGIFFFFLVDEGEERKNCKYKEEEESLLLGWKKKRAPRAKMEIKEIYIRDDHHHFSAALLSLIDCACSTLCIPFFKL